MLNVGNCDVSLYDLTMQPSILTTLGPKECLHDEPDTGNINRVYKLSF